MSRRLPEIMAAPECEPDILAAAPVLITDDHGHEYIELQGGAPLDPIEDAGVSDTFRVLERCDLVRAGITVVHVQYSKSTAVYIFPTPEKDRETSDQHVLAARMEQTHEERDLKEFALTVDELLGALMDGDVSDGFTDAAEALWQSGMTLQNRQGTPYQRMGLVMELDAVLASPGAAERAIRAVRDQLVAAEPALALMTTPQPLRVDVPAPLAISRSIDECDFEILESGSLEIYRSGHDVLSFDRREAYGLLLFFQSAGVAQLLEVADSRRQTEWEVEAREHQQTEADEEAMRDWALKDSAVRYRIYGEVLEELKARLEASEAQKESTSG